MRLSKIDTKKMARPAENIATASVPASRSIPVLIFPTNFCLRDNFDSSSKRFSAAKRLIE